MSTKVVGTEKAGSASRWRFVTPPRSLVSLPWPSLGSPQWRFVFSPRWLAWHAFAVVAFWGMCWLGDWQLRRALAGNSLSWAYTFEWPLFAIMGAVFWAKTIRDEHRIRSGAAVTEAGVVTEAGAVTGAGAVTEAGAVTGARAVTEAGAVASVPGDAAGPDNPERAAYDAYLARLHEQVKGHGRWHGLR